MVKITKTEHAVKHVISTDSGLAHASSDGSIIFLKENGVSCGKIIKDGVEYSGDYLDAPMTMTAQVGNVPAGVTFEKGTAIKDILQKVASYAAPYIKTLSVVLGGKTITVNTNMLCSGTAPQLSSVKHSETNLESIKTMAISFVDRSPRNENIAPSATDYDVASVIGTPSIDVKGKKSITVKITGVNTLGVNIPEKAIIVNFVMPVFTFVASSEANIAKEFDTKKTAEPIAYNGSATIKKTNNFSAGNCWCVALPSHLTCSALGTEGDFGFGTQQKDGFSTIEKTGVSYDDSNADTYTIFYKKIDTVQQNLSMRIDIKLK